MIDLTFTKVDFKRIEDEEAAQGLFKMAVFNVINNTGLSSKAKEILSVRHQVLCDQTAIIGVKQQENDTIEASQKFDIQFGMTEFERLEEEKAKTEAAKRKVEKIATELAES